MKARGLSAVLIVAGAFLPFAVNAASLPARISGAMTYERSDDEFASAVVIDAASGKVLYEYQPKRSWPAASLTKLVGALVFMDHRPSWNRIYSITKDDQVGGGSLRVAAGATLSAKDLLYSSITASANNAAVALARASGMSKKAFVRAMNAKAKEIGLRETSFVDPSGLEAENRTSARDVAAFAKSAFENDAIRRAASTASYTFTIRNTGTEKTIKSTDDLLIRPEHDDVVVTGGKTGFIYEARYNLVVRLRPTADNDTDRTLMVVVLGSPTRSASFSTAKGLAHWAWKAYRWGS